MKKNKLFNYLVFDGKTLKNNRRGSCQSSKNKKQLLIKSNSQKSLSILNDTTYTVSSKNKQNQPGILLKNGSFIMNKTTPTTKSTYSLGSRSAIKLNNENNTNNNFESEILMNFYLKECVVETNELKQSMIKEINEKIKLVDLLDANIAILTKKVKQNIKLSEQQSIISTNGQENKGGNKKIKSINLEILKSEIERDQIKTETIKNENLTLINQISILKKEDLVMEGNIQALRTNILVFSNSCKSMRHDINLLSIHIKTLKSKINSNVQNSHNTYREIKTHLEQDRRKYLSAGSKSHSQGFNKRKSILK